MREPAFVLLSESLETNARMRLSSMGNLWVCSYTGPDGMQYMRIRTVYLDADGVVNQVLLRFPQAEVNHIIIITGSNEAKMHTENGLFYCSRFP